MEPPGSVSRSVALPPDLWTAIDYLSKGADKSFDTRSEYIRELVKADICAAADGTFISSLAKRKRGQQTPLPPDQLQAVIDHVVEQLTQGPTELALLKKAIQKEKKKAS
jgi:hypothetical protein